MEKLRYDSLYKFIVSIGIVIIILPFIFIYSILNNNETIFVSENDINQLTNTAKDIILLEQSYKYIILSNPIIFIIIVLVSSIVGFLIVMYGIIQWKDKVQKYEDKSRELSNKLLENQIKNLTTQEKEEKIKEDIEIQSNKSNNLLNKQQISKYINIQEKVYKIIRREFKNYKIFEEVSLEKQKYDCIALATSDYASYDYIFEIKYFSTIKSIKGKIKKLELTMIEKELLYYDNSKRSAKTILIIIVDNFSEKEQLENKKVLDEIRKKNSYMTQIIVTDINGIEVELRKIAKSRF